MTTARQILGDAFTFHLNLLSPGEALDADALSTALSALNSLADEWNGRKAFLFQEILTASAAPIAAAYGTLGTDWVGISPGDEILGATCSYSTGLDVPLIPVTMEEYANIAIKSVTSLPEVYAHDGLSKVYFYPVPSSKTVTLRTKSALQTFADLDTDYTMPKGYRSALAVCVAELLAPALAPSMYQPSAVKAAKARRQIAAQNIEPAVIHARNIGAGNVVRIKRGY